MTAYFENREIMVKSTTLKCLMCNAEGLHDHILVIPADTPKPTPEAGGMVTPSSVIVLCKDCLCVVKMSYSEYLTLVKLPRL